MTLDATLRPTARRLIKKYGKDATLKRETLGTFDPAASEYSGGGTTSYAVKVSPPERFRQDMIDGQMVRRDDFEVLASDLALSITPTAGDESTKDTLVLDSEEYQIIRVNPVYSGEQVAMFRLHCRK